MKHYIIILSIILLSDCAISQEQIDSTITKKEGYNFGLTFGCTFGRVERLHYSNNPFRPTPIYSPYFLSGGAYFGLASLHNLNKDWDIGFEVGNFRIGDRNIRYWHSVLIATYGYYYPFEKRYFIRFGLENNIHFDFYDRIIRHSTTNELYGIDYHNKFNFRTSLSLGVGVNHNNTFLLNLAISVPLYNKYGYQIVVGEGLYIPPRGAYPTRLYYVISGGVTWLFI